MISRLQLSNARRESFVELAEIVVRPSLIVWQHFEQPHRSWRYRLGPFIFDRAQYERALGF